MAKKNRRRLHTHGDWKGAAYDPTPHFRGLCLADGKNLVIINRRIFTVALPMGNLLKKVEKIVG